MQDDGYDRGLEACGTLYRQIDRFWRFRLDPVAAAPQRAVGCDGRADAPHQPVKSCVTFFAGLYDNLELGAVLVVVHEWRQCHPRLARVAVAKDHQARRWDAFGQDLAAKDRHAGHCSQEVSERR